MREVTLSHSEHYYNITMGDRKYYLVRRVDSKGTFTLVYKMHKTDVTPVRSAETIDEVVKFFEFKYKNCKIEMEV